MHKGFDIQNVKLEVMSNTNVHSLHFLGSLFDKSCNNCNNPSFQGLNLYDLDFKLEAMPGWRFKYVSLFRPKEDAAGNALQRFESGINYATAVAARLSRRRSLVICMAERSIQMLKNASRAFGCCAAEDCE